MCVSGVKFLHPRANRNWGETTISLRNLQIENTIQPRNHTGFARSTVVSPLSAEAILLTIPTARSLVILHKSGPRVRKGPTQRGLFPSN